MTFLSVKLKKSHKVAVFLLLIFLIIILSGLVSIFISYHALGVTEYSVSSAKISEDISIAVISDLHESEFGKDNSRLIQKVRECNPDLIFTVGDMVNGSTEDFSYLAPLYSSLSEIAPTYSSLGNHEISNPHLEEIKEILRKHSNFLDNQYIETSVNGTDIRLGSLSGYHPQIAELNDYIKDFADTDKFTLLLSHCPEYYVWGVDEHKIDMMISGHTHGGQVILPFVGGVYAPEQGYFPEFDYGVFHEENATLVITRGLGSSRQPAPRLNNPPEIISLTLSPEVSYE